jgi:hypothetical protein
MSPGNIELRELREYGYLDALKVAGEENPIDPCTKNVMEVIHGKDAAQYREGFIEHARNYVMENIDSTQPGRMTKLVELQ